MEHMQTIKQTVYALDLVILKIFHRVNQSITDACSISSSVEQPLRAFEGGISMHCSLPDVNLRQ